MTGMAEQLHDAYSIISRIEDIIYEALEKYEDQAMMRDFTIGSDPYDNSIEIYFTGDIPRPWEPCAETRRAIYALGFGSVFWNFKDGTEIRGTEPRRFRMLNPVNRGGIIHLGHRLVEGVGYVDDEWRESWIGSKYDCRGKVKPVHPASASEKGAYEWQLCLGCGYTVHCKACGLNQCSGGQGENADGSPCLGCLDAHAWWMANMDECKMMNKRDRPMILEERSKARQRCIDEGMEFATLEDLKDI